MLNNPLAKTESVSKYNFAASHKTKTKCGLADGARSWFVALLLDHEGPEFKLETRRRAAEICPLNWSMDGEAPSARELVRVGITWKMKVHDSS